MFDSGSEEKTQNLAGIDSGTLDTWPPLDAHILFLEVRQ